MTVIQYYAVSNTKNKEILSFVLLLYTIEIDIWLSYTPISQEKHEFICNSNKFIVGGYVPYLNMRLIFINIFMWQIPIMDSFQITHFLKKKRLTRCSNKSNRAKK